MPNPEIETDDRSLIEQAMPDPAFTLTEHLVVPAPAERVYAAIDKVDLTDIHQPSIRSVMWFRDLPERLRHRVPRREPTRYTLGDVLVGSDWILLGRRPGSEVVGAAGRFWTPVVRWQEVTPDEFRHFYRRNAGIIAMAFAVHPYGAHRSVVTYETRIGFGDPVARRAFARYWYTVRPFVRMVSRRLLRAIRDTATEGSAGR